MLIMKYIFRYQPFRCSTNMSFYGRTNLVHFNDTLKCIIGLVSFLKMRKEVVKQYTLNFLLKKKDLQFEN